MESLGRYQLRELLGRGGMGQVYRAFDTDTDRIVAVKVLPAHLADDTSYQQRFRREARIAAGLNDPHIVPIHNYGEIDGHLYVDMRLIEGRDLGTAITDAGGRLAPERAVAIIDQVAAALATAHRAGLIHRDVKPANILLTATDFAYLIDFGIARSTDDTAMTGTGQTIGTLNYMAPERFSGHLDARSDVYALACVLYETLTGNKPFPGDTLEHQLANHLNTPPPAPSHAFPDIPPALDAVIAQGMAKNPDQRYQTAPDLATAARNALTAPAPVFDYPPQPPTQFAPTQLAPTAPAWQPGAAAAQRNNRMLIGGVIAALVAVAAVVGSVVFITRDYHRTTNPHAASTKKTTEATTATTATGQLPAFTPSPQLGANCQYPASTYPASKPADLPHSGKVPTDPATVSVSMVTDQGHIGLLLDNAESPCTVNSFVSLATQGFFNDTQCHRLTTTATLSILQCGDPSASGTGGPGYEFANEYPTDQYPAGDPALEQPVTYPRGTLAMANSGADTNGSQFFLVYQDSQLPPQYTVFGKIQDDGLATLDKIAAGGVEGGSTDGTPNTTVTITSVTLD